MATDLDVKTLVPQPADAQAPKADYLLRRDHSSCTRLNFQHYIWKRELGFNIHPSIELPDNAQIADVATGSAIWTIEVAGERRSAHIDCLDISLSQAPPQAWLPPAIRLHQWDMTDAAGPPDGLAGKFDLVHIRLVILALEDNPGPLITNVLKLLKPGGYLQWDENDMQSAVHLHPSISDAAQLKKAGPCMSTILAMMAERGKKDWLIRMPAVLEEHGFVAAKRHTYSTDRTMQKFETDLHLMAWDDIITLMPDREAERKGVYAQLLQRVRVEASNGHGMAHNKLVTVARKAG